MKGSSNVHLVSTLGEVVERTPLALPERRQPGREVLNPGKPCVRSREPNGEVKPDDDPVPGVRYRLVIGSGRTL
jgi:hypothetical protein